MVIANDTPDSPVSRVALVACLLSVLALACGGGQSSDPFGGPARPIAGDAPAPDAPRAPEAEPEPVTIPDSPAGERLAQVLGWVEVPPSPDDLATVAAAFDETVLELLPPTQLGLTLVQLSSTLAGAELIEVAEPQAESPAIVAVLQPNEGIAWRVFITIEPEPAHRITGLLFRPAPDRELEAPETWDELDALARDLAADASWQAAEIVDGGCVPAASGSPGDVLPIGSTFKLYVLEAVVDAIAGGTLSWDDTVAMTDASRSLPTGTLHTAEVGETWTVDELAARMIANSDNTATDLLLATVGREAVEAAVVRLGHADPDQLRPFLATHEMFALKAHEAGDLREAWVEATVDERRAMVAGLDAPPLGGVLPWVGPRANYDIEWFASTTDLCRAMASLHARMGTPEGERLADILSANPGVAIDDTVWPWVGYKGGSEPGVLNLTWLLRRADDRIFFFSLTLADPDVAFDDLTGVAIAAHGLALLESIP